MNESEKTLTVEEAAIEIICGLVEDFGFKGPNIVWAGKPPNFDFVENVIRRTRLR